MHVRKERKVDCARLELIHVNPLNVYVIMGVYVYRIRSVVTGKKILICNLTNPLNSLTVNNLKQKILDFFTQYNSRVILHIHSLPF